LKRRDVIALLGGAAAAWPLAARTQQNEALRRIGVLMSGAANDPEGNDRFTAFQQGLQQLGWVEGCNVRIEVRWPGGNFDNIRKYASELATLAPEVILATGSATLGPLLQATRTVPIVFVGLVDPVGAGYVASLAHPGGNATGFTSFEYGMSAKWLELLKQIAPAVTRVAVLRDPTITAGIGQFGAIRTAAAPLGIDVSPVDVRDPDEMERALEAFVRTSTSGGLIVPGSALAVVHRKMIITLAGRHKMPAVYFNRTPVADGGLMSYGPDLIDQYRRAASYVDRILKGEKPADLPVQDPTKYELVINLKAAKALGLTVPPSLLATANEVIE
jgi:putative tryptophan/tyrosine transport system substrate-binding protein